ncbi:unnamed protein product [Caretta caretta]
MLRRKAGLVAPEPVGSSGRLSQEESGPSVPAGGEEASGQARRRSSLAFWRRRKTPAPLACPEAPSGPKWRWPRVMLCRRDPGEGGSLGRWLCSFLHRKRRSQEPHPSAQPEPSTSLATEEPPASPEQELGDSGTGTSSSSFSRGASSPSVGSESPEAEGSLCAAERKSISYTACAVQMYLSIAFGDAECLLLAVMAYDRYVAICNPLLYTVTMSRHLCKQLVAGVYVLGVLDSMIHTCCTFRLSFCSSNIINHFFCDIPPLLALSCSDTRINEIVMFVSMCYIEVISFLTVLLSYVYITSTILQMHSAEGRHKAFSTCTFHLTAVVLFYGTLLFMYLRPTSSYSTDTDKVASVFYMLVIPMLNPLIYSLRNMEVKDALRKAMNKFLNLFHSVLV